jgi:hypothetical protein
MQAKATLFNAQQAHVVLQRLWLEVEGALVAGDQRLTLEIRPEKRSDAQNDRLWEMLTRVSKRMEINGRKYDPEQWKCIFMRAMGKEAQFLPTLDGASFFPSGFRSSQLTVGEMSDLQTFIEAHCAEQGADIWEAAE